MRSKGVSTPRPKKKRPKPIEELSLPQTSPAAPKPAEVQTALEPELPLAQDDALSSDAEEIKHLDFLVAEYSETLHMSENLIANIKKCSKYYKRGLRKAKSA